jgi:uncharacterized protein (UPF0332 family)
VISAFRREFLQPKGISDVFHKQLVRAVESRHSGDYRSGPQVTEEEARERIEWAEKFLKLGEEHLGSVVDDPES